MISIGRFHIKAIKIAESVNLSGEQRVVAFVLDSKGRILTTGWNSYEKTHPVQKKAAFALSKTYKVFMHAEVHALTRLSYKQLGKQKMIVVIRLGSNNQLLPSCPCIICSDVIREYGVETIIHY